MAQLRLPHSQIWDAFTHTHISVLRLFLLYAIPLSVIPPAMLYYASVTYRDQLLPIVPALDQTQLATIAVLFFVAELIMTFVVAFVIQRLGSVIDIKPAFEDCYKLAVVVPTPLWLAPLFFFIPSIIINLWVGSIALMLSGMLIFYNVPAILKVEEKGHAMLLSGSILAAGAVAWAMMLYITFVSWGWITASPLL